MGCSEEELEEEEIYLEKLKNWMCSETLEKSDYISGFLKKMDEFDLNHYIRAIHFDTLKVPKIPFQMPVSKHYYGLKEKLAVGSVTNMYSIVETMAKAGKIIKP